jgi:iron(III) transport system substrate-binding protein
MHSALYYFSPDDVGAVINLSGAALLESSNQRKNAERFIGFLVSKAGQQIIARSDDFEYPVHPDVAPNAALPPLASIGHTSLTVGSLGNGELAARLIREAGLV